MTVNSQNNSLIRDFRDAQCLSTVQVALGQPLMTRGQTIELLESLLLNPQEALATAYRRLAEIQDELRKEITLACWETGYNMGDRTATEGAPIPPEPAPPAPATSEEKGQVQLRSHTFSGQVTLGQTALSGPVDSIAVDMAGDTVSVSVNGQVVLVGLTGNK